MSQQRTWNGVSRIEQWAERLDRMSRVWRVVLSLLITLELVILLSLFIDRVLIDRVIAGDVGPGVPAWIAVILGIVFYGVGWWSLVGFDLNPNRPWRAGTAAVLYVAAGGLSLVLLAILALFGLAFGYFL